MCELACNGAHGQVFVSQNRRVRSLQAAKNPGPAAQLLMSRQVTLRMLPLQLCRGWRLEKWDPG